MAREALEAAPPFGCPDLSDRELQAITTLVYEKAGITLHAGKRALVVARLHKRLRLGGFARFSDYLRFVERDPSGAELTELLDAIATNHTSFFREPQHFQFLRDVVLAGHKTSSDRPLLGWSAACSTGEEPYTIAMICSEVFGESAPRRVRLLASDLSTKALRVARGGVYRADRIDGIPIDTLRRHFEKGLGAQEGTVRIAAQVRSLVSFEQRNLLALPPHAGPLFDFIFCRNVMIYFDTDVQQRVVSELERRLAPGGHLFIAHSESLNGVTHAMRWVAPATYRREPK
jgi:chemotaxis protein methyltransferase CheR